MEDTLDRAHLLRVAMQLFGPSWRGTKLRKMTNEQLESLIADTELSRSFWDQYDKEVAEKAGSTASGDQTPTKTIRPHQILGFDTADLDGQ
jgi:hypothetical protein